MNILCFTDCLGSGGAQRQLVTVACGLKARNHMVSFLVYHRDDYYRSQLESHGIQVHEIRPVSKLDRVLSVCRFLRTYGQDVVLAYQDMPSFLAEIAHVPLWGKKKWALVVSERSTMRHMPEKPIDVLRQSHRFADCIFTNSYTNRQNIIESVPVLDGKTSVIYNMLDASRFYPAAPDSWRAETLKRNRIVVAARPSPEKNVLGFLDALTLIKAEAQRHNLVVDWFGDQKSYNFKNYLNCCFEKVREDGLDTVIRFHPPTQKIEEEYRNCDAVGLFSIYEGLPNAVCEAMLCGKPILASRVSDVPKLVKDGFNGYTCDPADPRSIADCILSFLQETPERRCLMGENSRQLGSQLLNPDVILGEIEELLAKYVPKKTGR